MSEPRNRVVQVGRFGGPDTLEVVEAPLPAAGRGEVRVRVLASGLEYTDVFWQDQGQAEDMYPIHIYGRTYIISTDESGGAGGAGVSPPPAPARRRRLVIQTQSTSPTRRSQRSSPNSCCK